MSTNFKKIRIRQEFANRTKTKMEWTWDLLSSNGKVQARSPEHFGKRWKALRSAEDAIVAFRGPLKIQRELKGVIESTVEIPQCVDAPEFERHSSRGE